MRLPLRPLGTSGLEISVVGLGAWAMGGSGWRNTRGAQDDADSHAVIRHAIDSGVNWIDTAAVYGLGHAEEVVAEALADVPASRRPLIFTKGGLTWSVEDPMAPQVFDSRPQTIRRECEASLRRLRADHIDLYQLHWPDEIGTPVEDSWGEMARLADEGKVRAIGMSNYGVELLERCERVRHVDSVQSQFNMIRREAASDIIPWCETHGTGTINYRPMMIGLLTDEFTRDRIDRSRQDWRDQFPDFEEPRLSRNIALRDALRPIAQRHGATIVAIAVAWAVAWPGVTGAIAGARTPEQVDGWVGGGRVELTGSDLDEIAHAIETTGAGDGPLRPGRGR
jgi:aryl-alcohol dehydrogenase-like predicted oxidoreductase